MPNNDWVGTIFGTAPTQTTIKIPKLIWETLPEPKFKTPRNPDCGHTLSRCTHAFCDSKWHGTTPVTVMAVWGEYKFNNQALSQCRVCHGCLWCCACYDCSHCGNRRDGHTTPMCQTCAQCAFCCKCIKCARPGCLQKVSPKNFSHYFCEHGLCSLHQGDCCKPKIYFIDQPPLHFWESKRTQHQYNPTDRFISAEIEVAQCFKSTKSITEVVTALKGGIVEDQSLPKTGFEITTAPANGDLWVQNITKICDVLSLCAAKVTEKCGLHIHLDARDFTIFDLRRLILLYEKLEPALFHMVSADRVTHHNMKGLPYSGPCGLRFAQIIRNVKTPKDTRRALLEAMYKVKLSTIEADMEAEAVYHRAHLIRLEENAKKNGYSGKKLEDYMAAAKLVEEQSFEKVRGLTARKQDKHGSDARYAAVNFHSYFLHNTIEVRMHNGSVDMDAIIKWGIMWAEIMDWALKHTEEEITSFPDVHMCRGVCPRKHYIEAETISERILKEVVPGYLHKYIDRRIDLYDRTGGFML